jgi:hypothetical protein
MPIRKTLFPTHSLSPKAPFVMHRESHTAIAGPRPHYRRTGLAVALLVLGGCGGTGDDTIAASVSASSWRSGGTSLTETFAVRQVTKTVVADTIHAERATGGGTAAVSDTTSTGTTSTSPSSSTSALTQDATSTLVAKAETSVDVQSAFSLGQRPFLGSSSWNQPISSSARYSRLAWPSATGYNYWVNWEKYSPAVYVSTRSDPVVQVAIPYTWGWPQQTLAVNLPEGVTGAAGTDGEIIVIDGSLAHNCWQFKRTTITTATCSAYARADVLAEAGWGRKSPFLGAGIVAAGSSQLAGLLVQAETDAGEIEHALQIALDSALQMPGYVGEAISSDGRSPSGISREGERLAIPPGTPMPGGLSTLGQKVFRALMKYGAFNIDVAGGTTVLRAQANAYDPATIDALREDVNRLIPLLHRVD